MGRLKEDLLAYSKGSIKKTIATVLFNPGFRATKNYRIANFMYRRLHLEVIAKMLWFHNRKKYAMDIDYRCEISGGFRIIHGIGVIIGKDVRIGKNVTVYQRVILGGNMGKTGLKDGVVFSQPWIDDNVTVYANAMIIGPVHIGENSVIGPGSSVLKNISSDSVCYTENTLVTKVKPR